MKTSIFSNRITARWWWGSLAPLRRNGPAVRQRPVQVRASLGVGTLGLPSAIGGLLLLTLCLSLQAQSVIQFSAVSCRVTEETSQVDIIVQRTNDLETVVSVDFTTTTNGTAMAGADYVEVSTNLTFLANETNKTVAVPILNDSLVESSETFQVTLSNATVGAVLGTRTNATVRITDNDQGLAFEFARYSVAEDAGSVLIAVLRRDDGNFPVTVDYATTNLTAEAGQDYTETKGTLDFGVGETVHDNSDLPTEALGFRVQNYGMTKHQHLFTSRQLTAMTALSDLVGKARTSSPKASDGNHAYANAIATDLAFALDKAAEYNCNLVPWYTKEDRPKGLFARQAVPMVWDFAEVNPLSHIGGSFEKPVRIVAQRSLGPVGSGREGRKDARFRSKPGLLISGRTRRFTE